MSYDCVHSIFAGESATAVESQLPEVYTIITISSRMRFPQVLNAMRPASGPHFGDWPTHWMRLDWMKLSVACFPNALFMSLFRSCILAVPLQTADITILGQNQTGKWKSIF